MQCRNQHILRTLPTEIDTSSYKTGLGSAYPSLFMAQFEPPQQAILMLLKKKSRVFYKFPLAFMSLVDCKSARVM